MKRVCIDITLIEIQVQVFSKLEFAREESGHREESREESVGKEDKGGICLWVERRV